MTDYKQKYSDLIQSIMKREDIPADFQLEAINGYERAISEDENNTNQKPQEPVVTQEQFDKMGYTERLKLKNEHRETYERYKGGA